MNHSILRGLILLFLILLIGLPCISQNDMPDILKQGRMSEQLNYIEERTKIFEYYRAIREDMFQQLKRNTLDTLIASNVEVAELKTAKITLNQKIDSLNRLVSETKAKMDEALKTKNNINVLGFDVNKFIYNSVMWIIVASLAAILAIGFLIFKRNISVTKNTKNDLEELKNEFEAYRKQSREAREKMSMDHFNEIRRLRGKIHSNDITQSRRAGGEEKEKEKKDSDIIAKNEGPVTANGIKKTHKKRGGIQEQNGQGSLEV